MIQSEAQLETGLVKRLQSLGREPVVITDGAGLRANLKAQMEAHNDVSLSDVEFTRVLNHLDKGNTLTRPRSCGTAWRCPATMALPPISSF